MDFQNSESAAVQYAPPQPQPENAYIAKPKSRVWLWIVLSAVFVLAIAAGLFIALGGANGGRSIKGNAGVVALYEFFKEQSGRQEALTGSLVKEIGRRLEKEPFEIDARLEIGLDDLDLSFLPISSVAIGMEAKYDMKDLGIKANVLGLEVFGAYIIEDNVVVSAMGKAASEQIPVRDKDVLDREMGLADRVKALLPFLPEDKEMSIELLEAFAMSVPDGCTKQETADVYSPKADKDVKADVITTVLDAPAIIKTAQNLDAKLDENRALRRKVQQMIDGFTEFAGLDSIDLGEELKGIGESIKSAELEDIKVSWSVYSRSGSYIGVSFEIVNKDDHVSYMYISEFDGRENFQSVKTQAGDGKTTEGKTRTIWAGNVISISGESTADSEGTKVTQIYDGTIEVKRESANEYAFTADYVFNGDIFDDILNSAQGQSFDVQMEAEIKAGAGLGTLKEDRGWDGIYDKEWGSFEDLFEWPYGILLPGLEGLNRL